MAPPFLKPIDFIRTYQTNLSGGLWAASGALLMIQGGVTQPLEMVGGFSNMGGAGIALFLGDKRKPIIAAAFVSGASMIIFNAATHVINGVPAPDLSKIGYGACSIVGTIILYHGKAAGRFLQKRIPPVARLMNKLSRISHENIGGNLLNAGCASIFLGAVNDFIHGLTSNDAHLIEYAALSALIGITSFAGNAIASLRSRGDLVAEELTRPDPHRCKSPQL